MEGGQRPGQLPYLTVQRHAGAEQGGQPALFGHPAHHHQVVARVAVDTRHLGDAEVDIRGQPPVEFNLAPAGIQPPLPGAESRNVVRTGFLSL